MGQRKCKAMAFERPLLPITLLLGHKNFLGADATEAGEILNAAQLGTSLVREVKESIV